MNLMAKFTEKEVVQNITKSTNATDVKHYKLGTGDVITLQKHIGLYLLAHQLASTVQTSALQCRTEIRRSLIRPAMGDGGPRQIHVRGCFSRPRLVHVEWRMMVEIPPILDVRPGIRMYNRDL